MAIDPVVTETTYALTVAALGPFATVWPYAVRSDVQAWLDLGGGRVRLNTPGDYTQADTDPLAGGGTVTLSNTLLVAGAWPAGSVLTLQRSTPKGQPSSFGESDAFSPNVVEAALNDVERQVQEAAAILARTLQLPPGEAAPAWPRAADRVGKTLMGDGAGAPSWVLAEDTGPPLPFCNVNAAYSTNMLAATSSNVYLNGASVTINGFANVANGQKFLIVVGDAGQILSGAGELILTPADEDVHCTIGDIYEIVGGGGGLVRVFNYRANNRAAIPLPNAMTSIAVATTMAINAVQSTTVVITGQPTLDGSGVPAPIASLGPCVQGDQARTLYFAAFNWFNCDGVHLVFAGQSFFAVQPGASVLATPSGTNQWTLTPSVDSQFTLKYSYLDNVDANHAMSIKFGSPNEVNSISPDFLVNGSNATQKVWLKGLFISCMSNTPQLGNFLGNGTSNSPTPATSASFAHRFTWSLGSDSNWNGTVGLEAASDSAGLNHNQGFQFSDRNIQWMEGCFNAPTPTNRDGWASLGICPTNGESPVGHQGYTPNGTRISYGLFGRDSRYPMWNYAGGVTVAYQYPMTWANHGTWGMGAGAGRRDLFPSGWNPAETYGVASDMFLVADKGDFAIDYYAPDPTFQSGIKTGYDNATGSFVVGFMSGGSVSWNHRFNPNGSFEGSSDGQATLGEAANRFAQIYSKAATFNQTPSGTVVNIQNQSGAFSGADLIRMETPNTGPGTGANFITMRAAGNPYARIDLNGKGYFDGGTATSGAGFGEYYEWADGNPAAEDRAGWTVVRLPETMTIARAKDHPELRVIGVVSRRLAHVGLAASHAWHRKWRTDKFGQRLTQPVDFVSWDEPQFETTTQHVPRKVTETVRRAVTRVEIAEHPVQAIQEIDGKHCHVTQTLKEPVSVPVTELKPLHHADGSPVMIDQTRHAPDAQGKLQPVMGPDGQPIVDQVQAQGHVPVMEDVELERWVVDDAPAQVEIAPRHHCYPAAAVPEDVTPPDDAKRFTVAQPILHPDFDPARDYQSRDERPEHDGVSNLGRELVLKGERVDPSWEGPAPVEGHDDVEEWIVFPPAPANEALVAEVTRQVLAQLAAKA